jgi:hypothetical protein
MIPVDGIENFPLMGRAEERRFFPEASHIPIGLGAAYGWTI